MRLRKKNNRFVPSTATGIAPHGRPRKMAAPKRSHAAPDDPATKYVSERFAVRLATFEGNSRERRKAQDRADTAYAKLIAQPGGVQRHAAINAALLKVEPALRTAARAHVDTKPYAVGAALLLLKLIDEHEDQVLTVEILELFGGFATKRQLAVMLYDFAFQKGPGVLSATKSGKATDDSGTTISIALPAFGDCIRLAKDLDTAARGDLATALELVKQAREANRRPLDLAALLAPLPGTPAPADVSEEESDLEPEPSAPLAVPSSDPEPEELPAPLPALPGAPRAAAAPAPAPSVNRATAAAVPSQVTLLAPAPIKRTAPPADLEERMAEIRARNGGPPR